MPVEGWLTQEDAAQKLGVTLDTMRRWVRLGHFPRSKLGKRYLIPESAIEDYLKKNLEYGPKPVTPRKLNKKSSPGRKA